jgi:hypothetical protein
VHLSVSETLGSYLQNIGKLLLFVQISMVHGSAVFLQANSMVG